MNLKILFAHVGILLRDLLRTPAYVVPTVLFPSMFFCLFGLPYARANAETANFMLASFTAFAVVGVALFQFGVGIAAERGRPWERYLRSLPVSVGTRFAARILVVVAMATLSAGILATIARLFTPLTLSGFQWLTLASFAMAGAVPFVVIGLAIAYVAPPRAALPITNVLYLLGAYAGGYWMPPQFLPHFAAVLSPYFPTRQYAELLWSIAESGHDAAHAGLVLAYYTLAFAVVAIIAYRRDEKARYI